MNMALFKIALKMNWKRTVAFRTSFSLDILSSLLYSAMTVAFWQVLYTRIHSVSEFSIGQMFLFLFFVELFFTLGMSFFIVSGKLWQFIHTAKLDTYLTRPGDPRILMLLMGMRAENFVRALPSLTILLCLALYQHASLTWMGFFWALLISITAATTYALLQMAGSWVSFWVGRSQVIDELTDSLTELTQYPHTIFPKSAQLFLSIVLPFGLAGTQPALIAANRGYGLLAGMVFAVSGMLFWLVIQHVLWRKGLKRYESSNG